MPVSASLRPVHAVWDAAVAVTPMPLPVGPRIGVIYPSGAGNLGDEAILKATFDALRARWPNASLHAFTLHPARTAANHGVHAEALTGVHRRLFGAPWPDGPLPIRAALSLARRTRRIPLLGVLTKWTADWAGTVFFEAVSLKRSWKWLQTADLVLAAGGGQLDAVWGGTWGQPYALARWAWLARRARVPFAFLSVGYGGAKTRMSRWLLRYAVSNATYCSVRDEGSRALTEQLGVRNKLPIVPDLAFGLTAGPPLRKTRPGYDVGVSPMTYLRPGCWPSENPAEYQKYVSLWADVVRERVSKGDRVHLFVSDPGDTDAVRDVWNRLDDRTRGGCSIAQTTTPEMLLDLFRRLDVVVSSRLHGVLLAIVAIRPVLALSHERKVRAVMTDAGVAPFCLDLPSATLKEVSDRIASLTNEPEESVRRLRDYVAQSRASLRQQDELLPQLLRVR
ncbi:MAG TPA: polysaccharide pyruvyl transferase family protein [Gemmatimonadaceae bacterium]|nr:polysaccharide pyruvyl transferase family protein [Gemmatimonadaceae bacterium]